MTSGSRTRTEAAGAWRIARAALLVALMGLAALPALALDLPGLMGLIAARANAAGGASRATFTEQRFVRGFEGPLDASGTLSFEPPDKLVRQTTSPREETMRVDGNTLTLSRGGRTRTLTVDSMPELMGLIEAMRGTLAGDAKGLARYFRTEVRGEAASWTLALQPLDDRLGRQLSAIRLAGRHGDVLRIEMDFVGGDRSVMNITPVRGGS